VLRPFAGAENAQVYFIWPSDGMVIHGAFWVRMGLRNMGVAPKGTDMPTRATTTC
jgi:hypothetical protein